MIVDYRVYLTIYAILIVAYLATMLVPRRHFAKAVYGVLGAYFLTLLANYLDWLWS